MDLCKKNRVFSRSHRRFKHQNWGSSKTLVVLEGKRSSTWCYFVLIIYRFEKQKNVFPQMMWFVLYLTFGNMALEVTDVILRLLNRHYRDVSSNCFANVRMKSFLRSNPLFLVINNPPMSSTTFVFFCRSDFWRTWWWLQRLWVERRLLGWFGYGDSDGAWVCVDFMFHSIC